MIINPISGLVLRKFATLPYPTSEYVIIYFEEYSKKYPDPNNLIGWNEFDAALKYAEEQNARDDEMHEEMVNEWEKQNGS